MAAFEKIKNSILLLFLLTSLIGCKRPLALSSFSHEKGWYILHLDDCLDSSVLRSNVQFDSLHFASICQSQLKFHSRMLFNHRPIKTHSMYPRIHENEDGRFFVFYFCGTNGCPSYNRKDEVFLRQKLDERLKKIVISRDSGA